MVSAIFRICQDSIPGFCFSDNVCHSSPSCTRSVLLAVTLCVLACKGSSFWTSTFMFLRFNVAFLLDHSKSSLLRLWKAFFSFVYYRFPGWNCVMFFTRRETNNQILPIAFRAAGNHLAWRFALLQPRRWRCAECAVHHERNVREEQHHIHVARTSNNRVIVARDLYCCLLPQCDACALAARAFRSQQNGAVTRIKA